MALEDGEHEIHSTLISQSFNENGDVDEQLWRFEVLADRYIGFLASIKYDDEFLDWEVYPVPHMEKWTSQMGQIVEAWIQAQADVDDLGDYEAIIEFDSVDE